jgi:hypothetical protein
MVNLFSRILFFILLFVIPGNTVAFDNRIPGARSTALSQAVVALPGIEALFHNQAGITSITKLTLSLSFESPWLLKELSLLSFGIVVPSKAGTFGNMFYQFGTGVYRENKVGLGYSKKLSDKLAASLWFDYFSQLLPENRESFSLMTFEAGILYGNPGKWLWGIHIFNPLRVQMNYLAGKESVPWTLRTGCSWLISSWLTSCNEIEKRGGVPVSLKTGIEFSPYPNFSIRAGVSGAPVKFTGGVGFHAGKLTIDIAFSYHGTLGYSPSIGIQFSP